MTDRSIALVEPDGATLGVVLVTAGTRAGLPSATFQLDAGAWERVETSGLLHADPSRSRGGGRPFDPAKPVEVEAVLDPVAAIDGADSLLDRLLVAMPGDPLLSTEAWWALSATQTVDLPRELVGTGVLQEGIAFEHPTWLSDPAGSVGLEEAWQRAMELGERIVGESATPLLDTVETMFTDADFHVERPDPDATVLHAPVTSEHGGFDLFVSTEESRNTVTVYAVLSTEIPEDRVPDVLALAAKLNGQVAVGSFEPTLEGGLSFKTAIDVSGDHLSMALARNLVSDALVRAERALPALRRVLDDGIEPIVAALEVEL